jgi:DNA-binding CsgD family transcriptional regulator
MLVGRARERARIERLLLDAREGRSGALLLVGEAGIGKTALLEHAVAEAGAAGMLILRARGMQSESDIPFAGLSELLAPLLDRIDGIPPTQAAALRGALALGEGAAHDRFAVPAGVLSLMAGAAEERPVLVLIDDAQWLDESSLQAMLFAGRRLGAEGIAVLAAVRTGPGARTELDPWLERLEIGPLEPEDARSLLGPGIAVPVAERLVAGAAGNPLALLEIPTVLTDAQLAGREPLESPLRPGTGIKRAFRRRVDQLPDAARRALLVAAASESNRVDAILGGMREIGLDAAALEPAEAADVVRVAAGRLDFRHPLLRSTAYYAASAAERRTVHRALAAVAEAGSAERAWHLASATVAPEEDVAAALEAAALDARKRGAPGTAARDFARAAQLSPDDEPRARRLLEAATDAGAVGEGVQALAYLAEAEARSADPFLQSEIRRRRANVRIRTELDQDAYHALVAEADAARGTDPLRAAAMYLEASVFHMSTGDMSSLISTADRARELAEGREPGLELLSVLVIGEAYLALGERKAGDELLRIAEPFLLGGDLLAAPAEVLGMAGHSSIWIEAFDRAETVLARLIRTYRDASAVVSLIYPLAARAHLDLRRGRWSQAVAETAESVTLAEQTGQTGLTSFSLATQALVLAHLGREQEAREAIATATAVVERTQADAIRIYAVAALGHLELSLGRITEAALALEPLVALTDRLNQGEPALVMWRPDLIEALARAGRSADAEAQLAILAAQAGATGGRWAQAAVLRSRGLLAGEDEFRAPFEEALALHAELPMPFELARTQLAYGERLRRAKARADAREPLRAALATFERLGATAWAERAVAELRATGHASGRRAESASSRLTPHELQVALLVSQGMTNREVAAALFLSPKTIEYHLGQIYRKLDVRGRSQLARLMTMELPEGERDPAVLAEALS